MKPEEDVYILELHNYEPVEAGSWWGNR